MKTKNAEVGDAKGEYWVNHFRANNWQLNSRQQAWLKREK
jgi:hypothetical protein